MHAPITWLRSNAIVCLIVGLFVAGFLTLHVKWERDTRTEISIWFASPEQIEDYRPVVEHFERENPAYRVISGTASVRNLTGDPTRFLLGTAGGVPPDVIFYDRFAITEWAARGTFLSLDAFLARDQDSPDGIQREDYFSAAWDETVYRGRCYGIPHSIDNRALYCNKALLRRAGYVWKADEPQVKAGKARAGDVRPPQNWAELKAYAIKLTRKHPDGGIKTLGFAPNFGNAWLYLYGWMNGARFMSEDGQTCTMDSPEVVEALEYMVDVYDALGGVQEVYAFQQSLQTGPLDPFLNDQVAMKIDGNWCFDSIAAYKPDMEFLVAPAPIPQRRSDEGAEPISWSGGYAFSVPKTARNPEASWMLIQSLVSRKAEMMLHARRAQQARSMGRMYIPRYSPNRATSRLLYEKYVANAHEIPAELREAYSQILALLSHSRFRPVTPVGQRLWEEHVNAMEAALFHKLIPEEALKKGTAIVQRDLDGVLQPPQGAEAPWPIVIGLYIALIAVAGMVIWKVGGRHVKGIFRRELWDGALCASPWIFGFIIFGGGPILFSLIISFCSYDVFTPAVVVGLDNYREMLFNDTLFYKALGNTVFMLLGLPLSLGVGLGLALLLHRELKGMSVYRTIFYMPAVMPVVASSVLWIWMFEPNRGLLNTALSLFGIVGPKWLLDEMWAKPALIIMGLWSAGGGLVIWLGGLKSIPESLYEAASIDGAGAVRRFSAITLPMLSPYIFFNMIMGFIATFQIFDQAYVMTDGGPVNSTLFYAYKIFNEAFRFFRMGYASALAWVLFVLVLVLTLLQMRYSKRWVHYQGDA
ncbi:MAG: extracellular solute-binding protein [Verrucomicrobia bacterium]|jgi:ABC-type sugar transport system permease subunit/ABC-type glycerol-3-phosphate transport system substrate-binding protein|nr:extracellular solute-binding protein [Verrucomicrobiota bacterium]MBT7701795.1 extracellular solute-binding protein [Verrucomicrobiota bacterium]